MIIFILLSISYQFKVTQKQEQPIAFYLHSYQQDNILFNNANEAKLLGSPNNTYCQIQQRTVSTETQRFTIIQENDFQNYDFEADTPLNFREFVGMVQIRDGMLVITSDSIMYLLKFNYNNIYQNTQEFTTFGRSTQFATVVWKGDLKDALMTAQSRSEFPQIVYLESSNQGILIFSDTAQIFHISQMEEFSRSLKVRGVSGWINRKERGLTKEIDNLLLSAVGLSGLDIYSIQDMGLNFMKNFQLTEIGDSELLYLVDFSIYKINTGIYLIYLLDQSKGVICVEMKVNGPQLQFKKKIQFLKPEKGGIAIDTRNGQNVFVAYKEAHRYFVREYLIEAQQGKWKVLNEVSTLTRILDLEVNKDFAIIQGFNQHTIIFSNSYNDMVTHKEKIHYTHLGMRDFAFFSISAQKQALIQSEQHYGDFFFGITATQAFLTKFTIIPPRLSCMIASDEESFLSYDIQFNTSEKNQNGDLNGIIQHNITINIYVIETLLFDEYLVVIKAFIILLIIFILFSCGSGIIKLVKYQQEIQILSSKVRQNQQNKNQNISSNQIQMDQSRDKQ